MKRLNNKGFAISTLIYGLAIMGIMIVAILIATMAKTRSNNTNLVKAIEDDLNRFSKTQTSFKELVNSTGKPLSQEYIIPTDGWYKIELWGTQGGGNGGKGAYTGGVIELKQGDVLYFYVGKHQNTAVGGSATEVRIVSGAYSELTSYETSIMVAAGGGIDSNANGGTLYGYNNKMTSYGGFINVKDNGKDFSLNSRTLLLQQQQEQQEQQQEGENTNTPEPQNNIEVESDDNTNGTLVGFDKNYTVSNLPSASDIAIQAEGKMSLKNFLKESGHSGTNGGGDGYLHSEDETLGGVSYIAGYAGCYGVSQGKYTLDPKFIYYKHFYEEKTEQGIASNRYETEPSGEYYFVDGTMLAGVNTGNGYAKIERVLSKTNSEMTLARRNNRLNNVRYIKECSDNGIVTKIVATKNGNVSKNSVYTQVNDNKCVILDLTDGEDQNIAGNIDEITVFHLDSGKDYINERISVSEDGENWLPIKKGFANTGTELSETETVTGYRISAYQFDTIDYLKSGNYIIKPVLSENKVVTAAATADTNVNPITIEPYNGEKRQKWLIELITDKKISPGYNPEDPTTYEYKIIELARYKSLAISADENLLFNTVSALKNFNTKARNDPQIWKIVPVGDGTYTIETVVPQASSTYSTGYLTPQTNSTLGQTYNQIVIGKKNKETARFKFIQVDYSSE